MQHQRLKPSQITPEYEDAGLFKDQLCKVDLMLSPLVQTTARGDVLVTGFVGNDLEIAVTFAGRRAYQSRPLIARIRARRSAILRSAAENHEAPPDAQEIRMPVRIEGRWRPRFADDASGFQQRTYHLLAARWTYADDGGKQITEGEPPKV